MGVLCVITFMFLWLTNWLGNNGHVIALGTPEYFHAVFCTTPKTFVTPLLIVTT